MQGEITDRRWTASSLLNLVLEHAQIKNKRFQMDENHQRGEDALFHRKQGKQHALHASINEYIQVDFDTKVQIRVTKQKAIQPCAETKERRLRLSAR